MNIYPAYILLLTSISIAVSHNDIPVCHFLQYKQGHNRVLLPLYNNKLTLFIHHENNTIQNNTILCRAIASTMIDNIVNEIDNNLVITIVNLMKLGTSYHYIVMKQSVNKCR